GTPLWIILQGWFFRQYLESMDARRLAPRVRIVRRYEYARPQIDGKMAIGQLFGFRRRSNLCDEYDGREIAVAHPLEQILEKFEARDFRLPCYFTEPPGALEKRMHHKARPS